MFKHSLSKKICWLISLIITGFIVPGYAEITLDGSLGTAGTLPGQDYMIGAELGSRAGNNLFHSFGEFNINTGDSATFTGPSHIENIIGRVTGGNPSFINGALNSTIPSADLYLLNPNGVMMGPNAELNIDGSFHLSSADYLRFADGQRFEANTKVSPLLTVAPPEAFGFLDSDIGNIIIDRSKLMVRDKENNYKDLSIIGGDIHIKNGQFLTSSGRFQIASANSAGEVASADVMNNTLSQQGNIVIEGSDIINVGNPSFSQDNAVTIQGGQIWLNSSLIQGLNRTGDIKIASLDQLQIKNSILQTQSTQGQASNFSFTAQMMSIDNSLIGSTTEDGQAGTIHVKADERLDIYGIPFDTIFGFSTNTKGKGNGGNIIVDTRELSIIGNGGIVAQTEATGNAGDITLNVGKLTFQDGGRVNASSAKNATGNGGNITVNVRDSATIVGQSPPLPPYGRIQPSAIGSSAFGSGDSGTIRITAQTLNLDKYGTIQTLTKGFGDAGDIKITVHDLNITHGADIDASNEGNGYSKSGDIDITATGNVFITAEPVTSEETLRLYEKFVYNNHLGGVYSIAEKTGHGGNIKLTAGKLTLRDNGVISAKSTAYTGDGGNININTNELYISGGNAWIDVSSEFGLNGEFILNSTKLKDDFLGIPPPQFQDARLTYNRCASMSRENLSRFLIITRDILPPSPEDLRTHLYMPEM